MGALSADELRARLGQAGEVFQVEMPQVAAQREQQRQLQKLQRGRLRGSLLMGKNSCDLGNMP